MLALPAAGEQQGLDLAASGPLAERLVGHAEDAAGLAGTHPRLAGVSHDDEPPPPASCVLLWHGGGGAGTVLLSFSIVARSGFVILCFDSTTGAC